MTAMIGLDPLWYLFAIPGLLLGFYAQFKLMSTYGRYTRVPTQTGLSGAQAAREVLDRAGLHDVPVEEVGGHLTDHYDPTKRALFLSSENFHGCSVAAVGVAAHEAGHALQHQASYAPLHLRMWLVPATQFASWAWAGIVVLGVILGGALLSKFIGLAIGIFSIIALFQIVTLPVEFDASRRAKQQLLKLGLVGGQEGAAVSKVLTRIFHSGKDFWGSRRIFSKIRDFLLVENCGVPTTRGKTEGESKNSTLQGVFADTAAVTEFFRGAFSTGCGPAV